MLQLYRRRPRFVRGKPVSSDRTPLISVVAPCHNEEPNLEPLYWALSSALRSAEWTYELILVDDGSTDGTWPVISRIARNDSRVRGVRLARSFGQQAAILAGLKHARGDAVVTMDADLQHPPALIPVMARHWLAGKPVVLTRRTDSNDVGPFKRLTSAIFYRIFSGLTGVPMPAGTGEFRLIDRRVVDYLLGLREGEYFLRGLIGWTGFRSVTVPFHAAPRLAGQTKYSLRKMLRLAVSGVTAFSLTPLRIGTVLGLATAFLAFLELGYVLVQAARGHTVPGWASDVGVTTLLFGVQFILLGLIGEYLGRIYLAAKARPPFLIEETTGALDQLRSGSSDRRKSWRERRRRPMSP
jgi:dolichol-phosphate mannosyltransferase